MPVTIFYLFGNVAEGGSNRPTFLIVRMLNAHWTLLIRKQISAHFIYYNDSIWLNMSF